MEFNNISLPAVYTDSQDFRFFVDWFNTALSKVKYDTENLSDIYDPLRCSSSLIWALADTMGYKYDDRLCTAFNRLVLVYFQEMIRNKGSKNGITLAAETNLAQFNIDMQAAGYTDENNVEHLGNDILYERLENTSIPVNSVYVTPHTDKGYIDIVYFSTKIPKDACIEYVRPLGMYCFQSSGVKFDSRTKISIDARLTNISDTQRTNLDGSVENITMNFGPTQIAKYTRKDYASTQKTNDGYSLYLNMLQWQFPEFGAPYLSENSLYPQLIDSTIVYTLHTTTRGWSERIYSIYKVESNTSYSLSFEYQTDIPNNILQYYGNVGSRLFVSSIDQLPEINKSQEHTRITKLTDDNGNQAMSDNLKTLSEYTSSTFNFNSSDNEYIVIVFDWGSMRDNNTGDIHFRNLKLSTVVPEELEERDKVYNSNILYEQTPNDKLNPGYRSLYSLQLSNNEEIVKSLIDPIFSLGKGPLTVDVKYADNYLDYPYQDRYYNGDTVDASDLSEWNKVCPWTFTKPIEYSNSISKVTVDTSAPNSERLYKVIELGNDNDYTLSFKYQEIAGNLNKFPTFHLFKYTDEAIEIINIESHRGLDGCEHIKDINNNDITQALSDGKGKYGEVEFKFNSGDNTKAILVIDFGSATDYRTIIYLFDSLKIVPKYPNNLDTSTAWNLRLDKYLEESITSNIYTAESDSIVTLPNPAVNPIMSALGDSISLNNMNTEYTDVTDDAISKVTAQQKKDKQSK